MWTWCLLFTSVKNFKVGVICVSNVISVWFQKDRVSLRSDALVWLHHPLAIADFITLAGGLGGCRLARTLDDESWRTAQGAHDLGLGNGNTEWALLVLWAPSSQTTLGTSWENTTTALECLGHFLWCLDVVSVDWLGEWWTHHTFE